MGKEKRPLLGGLLRWTSQQKTQRETNAYDMTSVFVASFTT